jgi:RHS repeat-associated protein
MNSAATYIYGPVGRIAKRTTINQEANTYYYHTDHVGSTRLVTDDNKNIVAHTVYHPFGEPYSTDGSQDYSFTGKKQDATGLYYISARYYDPELGRFLTRDPKKGINQYRYCYNNPLKYIDPDGCEPTRWIFTDTCMPPSETEMQHPHVIYWMGKTVKNDYRAYGYFCLVSGIILAAMAGYVLLPSLYSYLSAHIASLATSLSAAGKKVASQVTGALEAVLKELIGLPVYVKAAIIEAILAIALRIIVVTKEVDEPSGIKITTLADDVNNIIIVTSIEGEGGLVKGTVVYLNDPIDPNDDTEYEYRSYQGGFQVCINGEWVQMPPGWLPGDEIPPLI